MPIPLEQEQLDKLEKIVENYNNAPNKNLKKVFLKSFISQVEIYKRQGCDVSECQFYIETMKEGIGL